MGFTIEIDKFQQKNYTKGKLYSKITSIRKLQRGAHILKKSHKKLQLLTLVLLAGLLFISTTLPAKAYIQKDGTVSEAVTLRQNADDDSKQVMELTAGQEVKVNNEITDNSGVKWYQVFVNGNTMGYVPATAVSVSGSTQGNTTGNNTATPSQTQTPTQTPSQTTAVTERVGTVTAQSAIRVREQASTSSEQVASMEVGDTFLVLDEKDAADGHVWYKVEFDDHGTTVYGYVRSDLVSVKEVTKQEPVNAEVPATTEPSETTEAPYSVMSQKDLDGTTVWYLLDANTGDAKEISALFANDGTAKNGGGIYKLLTILFLLLLIVAVGGATFFYMRWQEAEDFIDELREKQQKARKTQAQLQQRTAPVSRPASTPVSSGIPGMKPMPKPVAPIPRPISSQPSQQAAQPISRPVSKPVQQPTYEQPAYEPVTPNTADIVSATQRELQNNQSTMKVNPNAGWKSKNFLTDDDDLEFDFLDMDEKS